MSLFMSRFSFAMFSPFFPIALPMSPSFTTKISLSVASTQSTTVVRVRSWKRATYLIVCSSKTISTMRPQALRMFESPGLSTATAATEKGGPQVDVRAGELQQANLAEGRERVRRAVRRDDDDLRALRLRGATDFSQSEAHLARVRRDPEGPGDVDHGTTSWMGSSGSTAAASGAGTGTGTGTGGTGTGFGFGTAEGLGWPAGGW